MNNIKTILKVKQTEKKNQTIYNLKNLPLIDSLFEDMTYTSNPGIKILCFIIDILLLIKDIILKVICIGMLSIFGGALLLMIKDGVINSFSLYLAVTLYIIFNLTFYKGNKNKYNLIHLLKLDAKKYILLESITKYISNVIDSIMFGILIEILLYLWGNDQISINYLLITTYTLLMSFFLEFLIMFIYDKKNKLINTTPLFIISVILISIILVFISPSISFLFTNQVILILNILILIGDLVFILTWYKQTKAYQNLCNQIFFTYKPQITEKDKEYEMFNQRVKLDAKVSDKTKQLTGYSLFNELFIERHKNILYKKSVIITSLIIGLTGVLFILGILFPELGMFEEVNEILLEDYPLLILISYYINYNTSVIQAFFFNCDHAMLKYNFYREKDTINNLFTKRLGSLIKINSIPTITLSVVVILILLLGNCNNILYYIFIPITIIMSGLLFTTLSLSLYYLLQPYNEKMTQDSLTYKIIYFGTFIIVYVFGTEVENLNIIILSSIIIVLTIVYYFVILKVIKKYAVNTFKIRN